MIIGVGTDIVYIPRVLSMMEKFGNRFLTRVFSKQEILYSYHYSDKKMQAKHFAKRFAAKEAFVKAIGTGFSGKIKMTEIEVLNDNLGKPILHSS